MGKIYRGVPIAPPVGRAFMVTDGAPRPLKRRRYLRNHSREFAWGYSGSGPAQLALALLADATGNDPLALAYYQFFKVDVLAKLDSELAWEICVETVLRWLWSHDKVEMDDRQYYMHCALYALGRAEVPPLAHPEHPSNLSGQGGEPPV